MLRKILIGIIALGLLVLAGIGFYVQTLRNSLPQLITVKDYQPLMVSTVYDRKGKKVGEFARERRIVIPYEKIPTRLVQAFLAAEDDEFFEHHGLNFLAIGRAFIANMRAGRSVQGGSTITQQVAKTLLLSSEKTIGRKIKDMLLALEMEKHLSKQDILYLYLNQIYFGQSAYGIELAAQTYFRKTAEQLALPEMAMLAGLPQAPSRYSPVSNPKRAKERQAYVLRRMATVGFISHEESEKAIATPVKVYVKEKYEENAPYYLETIRQILVSQLGEDMVLDKGLQIYTALDLAAQRAAQEQVRAGLKELDKRQGFRGPLKNLSKEEEIAAFLDEEKRNILLEKSPMRTILPTGEFEEVVPIRGKLSAKAAQKTTKIGLPDFISVGEVVQAVVIQVDDGTGMVWVQMPDSRGVIDFETMKWARKPNPEVRFDSDFIRKPSQALRSGDVILVKVVEAQAKAPERFLVRLKNKTNELRAPDLTGIARVELDQDPMVEGALLSFDLQTEDVIAMVGGYDFARSEFNRALQAPRQTGSAFKAIVYAAALEKGFTPSTPIMDAPIVYQEHDPNNDEGQEDEKVWKPTNHSKSFGGDIILRNSLVKSLNVPSVKVIEEIGVPWSMEYAKRLGIFSPLNADFTLVLGSSSVTLYEMTKVFAHFARLGRKIRPLLISRVLDRAGTQILGKVDLDFRYRNEQESIEADFAERRQEYLNSLASASGDGVTAGGAAGAKSAEENGAKVGDGVTTKDGKNKLNSAIFFDNEDQLIRPNTAYVMTNLLKGVIDDPSGTGGRAMSLGRDVAGKTGSTNNYYDGWFIGYTPQIVTGVWVGYDKEMSLGRGEVGGRSALPIWTEFMRAAHNGLPNLSFPVPPGVVFANIDHDSGKLATAQSGSVVRQAYIEGTEPTVSSNKQEEDKEFLRDQF
jgi:penicillin-binding protein 1A